MNDLLLKGQRKESRSTIPLYSGCRSGYWTAVQTTEVCCET